MFYRYGRKKNYINVEGAKKVKGMPNMTGKKLKGKNIRVRKVTRDI
jgi:hypothetical protein